MEFTVKFNPFGEKTKLATGMQKNKSQTGAVSRRVVSAISTDDKTQTVPEEKNDDGVATGDQGDECENANADEDIPPMPVSILHEPYIPPFVQGRKTRQLFASNIHIREGTPGVTVNKVEFIKSSSKVSECPRDGHPEFAMIGRSNVGKSSLINLLVNRKKMALVSKTPGKTQLINHYLINKSWYLVDLPGYGYAKAPKAVCLNWNNFTKDYFKNRKTLAMVILLVDSSSEPTENDIDCASWLVKNNVPTTLAFTKCDKGGGRRSEHAVKNVMSFLVKLKEIHPFTPAWIMTSCVTGQGKNELMLYLSEMRKYWHS